MPIRLGALLLALLTCSMVPCEAMAHASAHRHEQAHALMGQPAEMTPDDHAAVFAPDHGHPQDIGLDLASPRADEPLPIVIATRAVLVVPIIPIPTAPPIDRQVRRAGDEHCRPQLSIRAPPTFA